VFYERVLVEASSSLPPFIGHRQLIYTDVVVSNIFVSFWLDPT